MKYKVTFLPGAYHNLREIDDYLSRFYPSTPAKFFKELDKKLMLLEDCPYIGALYMPNPKYRRVIVGDYLTFYTVDDEKRLIEVHRVLHAKQLCDDL